MLKSSLGYLVLLTITVGFWCFGICEFSQKVMSAKQNLKYKQYVLDHE